MEGLSLGGRPRGAGEAAVMDPSSYVGLSLSTETLSVRVPSWILKNLSPRSRTLYGPLYRGERGRPGAPLRTKTNVEDRSSLGTASGWVRWCWGCKGSKLFRDLQKLSRNAGAGSSEVVCNISPGTERAKPKTSSPGETLVSDLGWALRPRRIQGRFPLHLSGEP